MWHENTNETTYCSQLPRLENKLERNPDGIITKSPAEQSGEVSETKSTICHPIINKVDELAEELLA